MRRVGGFASRRFRETTNIFALAENDYNSASGLDMDAFFDRFVPVAAIFFGIAAVSAVCNFASVRFVARMACKLDVWLAAGLLYEFEHSAASLLSKSVFAQRPSSRRRLDRRPQRWRSAAKADRVRINAY